MSNNNNSRIRVIVHNHEEYDYEYEYIPRTIIMVESSFDQPVFYGGNPEEEILNALDQVSMLNVMGSFFNTFMEIGSMDMGMGMSDDRMMEIAQQESLDYYKTQEKKPHIKLGLSSKIVTESMKKGNLKNENCTICVSNFEIDDNITQLECKHILHTDCVAEWVKYKSECPVCRSAILTIDETPELKDENDLDD